MLSSTFRTVAASRVGGGYAMGRYVYGVTTVWGTDLYLSRMMGMWALTVVSFPIFPTSETG